MQEQKWFFHELRVRYQETDQMGVVYHANYLNWFEIGRTEMIRRLGMPYRDIEPRGLLLPVIDLNMKFIQPAKYDDLIQIRTRVAEFSHVRLHFEYEIWRLQEELADELLVTGSTRHVWVNAAWKPVRIDKSAPDLFSLIASGLVCDEHKGGES